MHGLTWTFFLMSDPLLAVTRQDADDLSRLLAAGWEPARLLSKTVTVPDLTVWTEVVLRDWDVGLRLFDQYFPEITRRPDVWRIALRGASHKCLAYLWSAMGYDRSGLSEDELRECVVSLLAAMGEPWSPSFEIRNILPVVQFFQERGVRLDAVVPGDFEVGDLRLAGHSLFTRAVATRRWEVVKSLWPDPTKPLPAWPRLDEVILGVLDVVGGDYRPLKVNSFIEARAALRPVPFRELSFMPGLFQQLGVLDDRFLAAWILDFRATWPATDPAIVDALTIPSKDFVAPWLRLPLLMDTLVVPASRSDRIQELPDPELDPVYLRASLWQIWRRVLAADPSQAWLRALARYPEDYEVQQVMDLLRAEAPDILDQFWEVASPDGLSPAQIWSMQSGQEDDDPVVVAG